MPARIIARPALPPLKVLITNIVMTGQSGTVVVVAQLADALRGRGHRVAVFAPELGEAAAAMQAAGHVVVNRLSALPWRPDVIHGHHTAPTMAALAAFPGVPALYLCHDATAPFDAAPSHPRLHRLFAVDERCRARLVAEGADVVGLLFNAIDLARIPARARALPDRPARAVAMTKQAGHLPALRDACAATGIELEEFGAGPARMVATPEAVFADADLVFATARTAMEAAACGAGVVVVDARGLAGFLTPARAAAWLPWNLGAGILDQPADTAGILAAIGEWSATEAEAAGALIRAERPLTGLALALEEIYAGLVAGATPGEAAAEGLAVADFIAGWVPSFDQSAPWRRVAEAVLPPVLPVPVTAAELMPAEPLPIEPLPVELPPVEFLPVEPLPIEPPPIETPSVELPPVEPPPVEPSAVEPSPVEPAAIEPAKPEPPPVMAPPAWPADPSMTEALRGLWRATLPHRLRAAIHRVRRAL